MKQRLCWLIILLVWAVTAQATASEITIWDNQGVQSEDQEVEPGANTTYSAWDLEGMFFDGQYLSIVGEWNFISTVGGIGSGDIFISTSGGVVYGGDIDSVPGTETFTNTFGYNYVFDVDWEHYADGIGGSYDLWQIDEESLVAGTRDFDTGNPASYVSGGPNDELIYHGTYFFSIDSDSEFTGGTHHKVSNFDLTKITDFDGSFTAHFTQECGNDVVMGQVPEPATMVLVGIGLLGIGAIGRRLPLTFA